MEAEASLTMLQVDGKSLENDQLECIIRGYQQLLGDDVPEFDDATTVAEQRDPEATDQEAM